jgi:hypothetical protein
MKSSPAIGAHAGDFACRATGTIDSPMSAVTGSPRCAAPCGWPHRARLREVRLVTALTHVLGTRAVSPAPAPFDHQCLDQRSGRRRQTRHEC